MAGKYERGQSWSHFALPRFFGLDRKSNVVDVKDGNSLDCVNVYQNKNGVVAKRPGDDIMFDYDEDASTAVDEIGSCTLSGTKYYYKFAGGNFYYSTSLTGAQFKLTKLSDGVTSLNISTTSQIWCVVLQDKLFFVDGTNNLRYFDGSAIRDSSIYQRPTQNITSASGAGGFTYTYTVDNVLGESPAWSTLLTSIVSGATIAVPKNTGPQTLVAGDVVRIYSRADSIAAASKLVATHTVTAGDLAGATFNVATVAIADTQPQLYSELGVALNYSAPSGLTGIISHYGRLVGWKTDYVYNSKVSNPHSWPTDSAQHEAFVYGVWVGDGENIQGCASYKESLFVGKKTNIAVFGGIGPDDTGNNAYSFRRLETNGNGVSSPKSMKVIGEEKKNYLIYRSQMGFFATNGADPIRIGEKIEPDLQLATTTTQAAGVSYYDKREGLYCYFEGAGNSRTGWVLDVREDEGVLVGWFKWSDLNVKSVFWDGDRALFGFTTGFCASQRISGTSADFSDVQVEYVSASAVDTSTEIITVANSYQTGDQVKVRTSGTIPSGITANTTYYVIRVSATQIKLATSLVNAQAGTAINITTQGVGTHSIVSSAAISAYYTTNWLKFKTATHVKKLSKLGLVFNAAAASVNITVQSAYDYVETWQDSQTVTVGSSHIWGQGAWGSFVWGVGATASPRNVSIARRKVRSIRYKFANSTINQDFNLQGLEQGFQILRNRGNFAA